MPRTLTPVQRIERSIQKKYRKTLWTPFVLAVKRYDLIRAGDRVAVCVSGDGASMLLAKLVQLLRRYGETPFEARYLALDTGCSPDWRRLIDENAARLGLPVTVLEADACGAAARDSCRLCARSRRERLCGAARAMGCNKLALGHHFNDVIETTVAAMLYGARLRGVMPRQRGRGFPGVELIRPLYCVRGADIAAWQGYNGLSSLRDACRPAGGDAGASGREAVNRLLTALLRDNPDVEKSVFNALHAVNIDTFPGWQARGKAHGFLEAFDE